MSLIFETCIDKNHKPAVFISLVINCPHCGKTHVDRGEWEDRPHHTHLCEHCGKEFEVYVAGI